MHSETSHTVANKIYTNYNEALALCQGVGYSMEELTDVVIKKNIAIKKLIRADSFLDSEVTRTLLSIGFAINSQSLRVIDFGGGGGYHYTLARHVLGDACNIKWHVVETESMCRSAAPIADESLKFFSDIKSAQADLGCVDLVLTSSALQYCPEPIVYLKSLLEVSAKYVYITRTPFFRGEQVLVSIQGSMLSHNGPGALPSGYQDKEILYPISFAPLGKVEALIKEKYKIKFKVLEEPATLFIENEPVNPYYGFFCQLQ